MRACGPSTGPTACALAGRRCSLWGWRKGVPGGGAFHRCEGRLVSGAVPRPVVVCFLGTRLYSCASLFLKIRNPKSQSTNLAGSLDGAPIVTQSRRHKPCSKIEVSYSAHSQLAFDASLLFTDCQRDCDCDLRFARCCAVALLRCAVALLLFEAITLPPR